MRKLWRTALFLSLTIVSTVIEAQAAGRDNVLILHGGIVTQNLATDKTDFDLVVKSDTELTNDTAGLKINNGGTITPSTVAGNGTRQLTYTWNTPLARGDMLAYVFSAIERRKNKYSEQTFFTPRQSPTDIPSLGWDVTQSGEVFLLNDYPSQIHFENLLFQRPSTLDINSLLSLLSSSSGSPGPITSGDVPAAGLDGTPGQLFVGSFLLSPGDFLTARLNTRFVDVQFSRLTEVGALGHEHPLPEPIPEPSSLVLLLGGLATYAFSWFGTLRNIARLASAGCRDDQPCTCRCEWFPQPSAG